MTRLIYLIYASIHIAILTLTGSIVFSVFLMILLALLLYLYRLDKYIVPVVSIGIVSVLMVFVYTLRQWHVNPQPYYVGTGIISDYYRTDRYIVDRGPDKYILRTDNRFYIGDEIFFQAYQSTRYTGGLSWYNPTWSQVFISGYTFDYAKWQYMRGLAGTLYSTQSILVGQLPLSLRQEIKQTLRDRITSRDKSTVSAIMLGVLLWDRSLLQPDEYQGMISSWFVHLIAVSGWNIAFLVIVLQLILFFVPYYARLTIIACCIVIYARLCGADSSVLRATLMWLLSIVALFAGRPTYIWRILGITWIGLLMYNPYFLVYDIWFSFSFAAIIGIVLMQKYCDSLIWDAKRQKIGGGYISATLGASLWVMPFLLFFTYRINLLSILTNIIISPRVWLLTIASIGKSIVPHWIWRDYPVQWMLYISKWTSIHGVYIVVDKRRFAGILVFLAIGYFIYTMYNYSQPDKSMSLWTKWRV